MVTGAIARMCLCDRVLMQEGVLVARHMAAGQAEGQSERGLPLPKEVFVSPPRNFCKIHRHILMLNKV